MTTTDVRIATSTAERAAFERGVSLKGAHAVPSTGRTGNRRYRRNREQVLAASRVCWLCGESGADTVDHVTPYSHGGGDDIANLRPAHRSCNSARGNRGPGRFADLGEWGSW